MAAFYESHDQNEPEVNGNLVFCVNDDEVKYAHQGTRIFVSHSHNISGESPDMSHYELLFFPIKAPL